VNVPASAMTSRKWRSRCRAAPACRAGQHSQSCLGLHLPSHPPPCPARGRCCWRL